MEIFVVHKSLSTFVIIMENNILKVSFVSMSRARFQKTSVWRTRARDAGLLIST